MRGRTPKAVAAVGAVAALGLVVAGCTSTPATAEKTVLRIYASEPAFLVPMSASDDPSIQVIRELYRGLVRYDNDTGKDTLDPPSRSSRATPPTGRSS